MAVVLECYIWFVAFVYGYLVGDGWFVVGDSSSAVAVAAVSVSVGDIWVVEVGCWVEGG
jgi:hypothetical protein